jgi:DNA-binding HxlR family transcriptional regulator
MSARLQSLSVFSTNWIRPKISSEELAELLKEDLIERRRSRSHLPRSGLYRLTAKGLAMKLGQAGGMIEPS